MSEHEPTPVHTTIDPQALDPMPPPTASDPRRITTHVMRHGRPPPGHSAFLAWPAASSLIFLLSAACLLGGAWTVFSSLGIDPEQIRERLAMIGTVHLYELALVAVAVVLCRFQRANPDAIGPVILGACFLVGAAVTLDLVSIDAPYLTLTCGITGLLLMCGKGLVLARLGGGASHVMLLLPLALLMSWNLLWPAVMGLYLHHSASGMASTAWWMPGWIVVLLGTATLTVGIIRDDGVSIERLRPFLRRSTMRWVLGLAIAGCSAIHLLVLGYLHSLDVTLGEVLPMLALLCLAAVDLRHRAAGQAVELDRLLLALPGGLALAAVLSEEHGVMSNPQAAGVVFTPAMVLLAYAAMVWRLGDHRGQYAWRWIAAASSVLGVLLWGANSHLLSFHWSLAAMAIAVGFAVRAVHQQQPTTLAKALVAVAGIALFQPEAVRWQLSHGWSPIGTLLLVAGSLVLGVLLIDVQRERLMAIRSAVWLVMAGALASCMGHPSPLTAGTLVAGVLLVVHVLTWWRTRDVWTALPLLVPLLAAMPFLIPANKGWLAVWAAFALLAVGVAVSRARVMTMRGRRSADPSRLTKDYVVEVS